MKIEYEKTSEYIKKAWLSAVKKKDANKDFLMPCDYIPPCVDGAFINLYYWDTYFTNLGLYEDGLANYAYNNIKNLIFCLDKFGCVPNICCPSGAMYASQPPLLFMMIRDEYSHSGNLAFLAEGYRALRKEYDFWMTKRISKTGLNRYGSNFDYEATEPDLTEYSKRIGVDLSGLTRAEKTAYALDRCAEGESGHDYTPRFSGRAYETNPIDLNSYLYGFERTMAEFASILGKKKSERSEWEQKAEIRKKLMGELLLDKESGVYFDYDFERKEINRIFNGANYLPYVFKITENKTALQSINARLMKKYGVLCCEKLKCDGLTYQWGYPNSWAPYNYFAYEANRLCGSREEFEKIAKAWLDNISETFLKTGKLYEKYDAIVGGAATINEYGVPEMLGWTAGTFEKILSELKNDINEYKTKSMNRN